MRTDKCNTYVQSSAPLLIISDANTNAYGPRFLSITLQPTLSSSIVNIIFKKFSIRHAFAGYFPVKHLSTDILPFCFWQKFCGMLQLKNVQVHKFWALNRFMRFSFIEIYCLNCRTAHRDIHIFRSFVLSSQPPLLLFHLHSFSISFLVR